MKLIKIKEDHYVVVDETSQPVNGWYYDTFINKIRNTNGAEYGEASHCWQITHSTQPLETYFYEIGGGTKVFGKIQYLSLQEVKELIGEVDVEKKVKGYVQELIDCESVKESERTWISAICHQIYKQALEDNKEKKYTEEDLRKAIKMSFDGSTFKEITQSLQPKTKWEVELVDGKLKLI